MALIEHLELTEYDLGGYSLGARTTVRMLAGFGAAPRRVIVSGMGLSGLLDTGKRAGHFRNILTHLGSFERGSPEWLAGAFLKTTKGDPVALLGILDTFLDPPRAAIAAIARPTPQLGGDGGGRHGSPEG